MGAPPKTRYYYVHACFGCDPALCGRTLRKEDLLRCAKCGSVMTLLARLHLTDALEQEFLLTAGQEK